MAVAIRLTYRHTVLAVCMALTLYLSPMAGSAVAALAGSVPAGKSPNILFFIMDNVGIDQHTHTPKWRVAPSGIALTLLKSLC